MLYSLSVAVYNLFSEQSLRKIKIIFIETALPFIAFGIVAVHILSNIYDILFNNSNRISIEISMENLAVFISSQSFHRYHFH